ncbi:photosystem I reaction center subunit N [Thalictrum thalictroides]|uniref:Photosystem I reaction center subunit N n=1 Tax=Thalictrum thalictroides TaxID=46969 RepID=A0A7J6VS65_THATH|nr:photosystem I reaction center subunit N [Thalictrum thalictroides]
MASVTVSKRLEALSSVLASHGGDKREKTRKTCSVLRTVELGRRGLLLSVMFTPSATLTAQANDSKTALLQKYLKKSEENKEKNDKERRDDYYKRNFKDYFQFLEGSLEGKTEEQLTEAEKGILEWLKTNK